MEKLRSFRKTYRLRKTDVEFWKPGYPVGNAVLSNNVLSNVTCNWKLCDICRYPFSEDNIVHDVIHAECVINGKKKRVYQAQHNIQLFLEDVDFRNKTLEKMIGLRRI